MNAFGLPLLVDGLNDAGLYVGLFYFSGYAEYQGVRPSRPSRPSPRTSSVRTSWARAPTSTRPWPRPAMHASAR